MVIKMKNKYTIFRDEGARGPICMETDEARVVIVESLPVCKARQSLGCSGHDRFFLNHWSIHLLTEKMKEPLIIMRGYTNIIRSSKWRKY